MKAYSFAKMLEETDLHLQIPPMIQKITTTKTRLVGQGKGQHIIHWDREEKYSKGAFDNHIA